jgi:hypothetical protein
MMKRFHSREKGFTIVFAALSMVVLLGIAALAIDGGVLFTAKGQLQDAVDAAALAGASGLVLSQQEAINRAISFAALNNCINQPVTLSAGDITFPAAGQVRVEEHHTVNLFFARVLGMNSATIGAVALAELNALVGTDKVKPWAVPFLEYTFGDVVDLKEGGYEVGTPNSWYNPLRFPPGSGAAAYRDNVINGSQNELFVGDQLNVEPGNMVGPTQQAVNALIAQDPGAYWDYSQGIIGSAFPGSTSPRIIKVVFYDPAFPPGPGLSSITITIFGAFFLEGIQGKTVVGRFIQMITSGTSGSGPGPGHLKKVRLIN